MKKAKPFRQAHTANTKKGAGDFYGTGFKNPVGRIRDTSSPESNPLSKKKLRKPPKGVV